MSGASRRHGSPEARQGPGYDPVIMEDPTAETVALADQSADRARTGDGVGSDGPRGGAPGRRLSGFPAAVAPMLVLWLPMLAWYALLRPGVMTNDSIDTWNQVVTGRWVDWHPPVYTALHWISYQLVGTPAISVLVQSAGLAWALSRLLRIGVRLGLPALPVFLGGMVIVALPPVGAFSVHLWKDVPYTIGFLLLVELVVVEALSRLELHCEPPVRTYVTAGLGIALMMALRPNGVLVIGLSGFALVVLARNRIAALITCVAGVLAALLVSFVVTTVADVEPPRPYLRLGVARFDLGNLAVNYPDALDADELDLVEQLSPLDDWRREFDCHWEARMMTRLAPPEELDRLAESVESAWRRHLFKNPIEMSRAHLCAAGVAWNPFPTERERAYFETLYMKVIPNELGMEQVPLSRSATEWAQDVIVDTSRPGWQPWFWRAPTWIYLGAVLLVIAAVRNRTWWPLFVLAPFVAQQISVIAMTGPHARYMLPAGIGAFFLIPTLVVTSVRPAGPPESDGTRNDVDETGSDPKVEDMGSTGSDRSLVL